MSGRQEYQGIDKYSDLEHHIAYQPTADRRDHFADDSSVFQNNHDSTRTSYRGHGRVVLVVMTVCGESETLDQNLLGKANFDLYILSQPRGVGISRGDHYELDPGNPFYMANLGHF